MVTIVNRSERCTAWSIRESITGVFCQLQNCFFKEHLWMAEAGKTKMNERMNKKETVVTTKSVNF